MPFKTQYGKHYHMTQGCHGATIPCSMEGLEPCSDCCDGSQGAGGPGGSAGGGAGALAGSVADAFPAPEASEGDAPAAAGNGPLAGMPGAQDDALDAYDSSGSTAHAQALVDAGSSGLAGASAPTLSHDLDSQALASMTDSLVTFDLMPLACPDAIPDTWGARAPEPEALPTWDAPVAAPHEYWYHEMATYSPDETLSMQVAAALEGPMRRWPGATYEMLQYGLAHGFMTAPASTAFHLNTPGGLACHSASVAAMAIEMLERPENAAVRAELGPDWREITQVVCLWHDACKMDYYEPLEYPQVRSDGNVAYYRVAGDRQGDQRHGELSADIVRHFYGDVLPEQAYQAIEMHMGSWDHRRNLPRWAEGLVDGEREAKAAADEADRRSQQDARLEAGDVWWQLQQKVDERRRLAAGMAGRKGWLVASEAIAASSDPNAARVRSLLSVTKVYTPEDIEARQAAVAELESILATYDESAAMGDAEIAREILAQERAAQDEKRERSVRQARERQAEAEAFAEHMARVCEEHPFVRIVHEADAASAALGR